MVARSADPGCARGGVVCREHLDELERVHRRVGEQRKAEPARALCRDRGGDPDVERHGWDGCRAGVGKARERDVHQLSAVFPPDAETVELRVPVAERHAQRQPALAEAPDGYGIVRHLLHRMHRQQHHRGPYAEARRSAQDGPGHGDVSGAVTVEPEVMLGKPDRVEPQRFGDLRILEDVSVQLHVVVRPLRDRLHAEDAEAEPQGHPGAFTPSSMAASAASCVPLPTAL